MNCSLKGRHFLSSLDFQTTDYRALLDFALHLKHRSLAGDRPPILQGRTAALIFQKPSLRTLVSFQVAMQQLGGHGIFLGPEMVGLGKREPARDVARVLAGMCDVIVARVFAHSLLDELAQHSVKPVINALCDDEHPCQILADLLTLREIKGRLAGLKLAYVGDGNNVARSLAFGGATMGLHVVLASPEGYTLPMEDVNRARAIAEAHGGSLNLTYDPQEAVVEADAVYTDVWASMGQEAEAAARRKAFAGFCVTPALLDRARRDVTFLHCLPAHYGEETVPEAVDDPRSAVFRQAENRLHAQKALLAMVVH